MVAGKKAKLYDDILKRRALHSGQPQRYLPRMVGVHDENRKGQHPSIQYIHGKLTANIEEDGFSGHASKTRGLHLPSKRIEVGQAACT